MKIVRVPLFLILLSFLFALLSPGALFSQTKSTDKEASEEKSEEIHTDAPDPVTEGYIAVIDMEMMILPGTQSFLEKAIYKAETDGAKLLIVRLNTPGGILQTTQKMIQRIFQSKVPVVVYVSPTGGSATSAGVFITQAGHVAAMAPGTSIGSAHPVTGGGEDIEGDMRKKVEEATAALVKSITEQRGRNTEWVEKAVVESVSITDREALEQGVIDIVAKDIDDLVRQVKGRTVKLVSDSAELGDMTKLPIRKIEMDFNDEILNVLANPNVAAILWLAATTGISIELYNPGLIFPGVVGVICLVLALSVSQVIPLSQGGLALLIVGAALLGAEIFVGSGILAIGGVISMVLGALYLIDVVQAPGLEVSMSLILPLGGVIGTYMFFLVRGAVQARRAKSFTGSEGLIGRVVEVREPVSVEGKVFVDGEIWNATSEKGLIDKGSQARVTSILPGMKLQVEPLSD